MKKLVIAAAVVAASAAAVQAGGMAEPMMAPEVMVETASEAGSSNWLIPLILLALVVAASA